MSAVFWIVAWFIINTLLGLGNTVGYHRMLTHRAFKATPFTRTLFTWLGAAHSGSPMVWVGLHRLHHSTSDSEDDPHSPRHRGFWFAHSGWLINTDKPLPAILFALSGFGQQAVLFVHDVKRVLGKNPPTWRQLCPDLMKEPMMRWMDAPFVMPAFFALQLAAAWLIGGWWGILWLWAMHVTLTNGSWAVNSVCHWPSFGTQPFNARDDSRDVWWIGLLAHGEGYHNAHHRYPRSSRHALDGGPDLSWLTISLLVKLGLASDPWLPKKYR